MPRIDPELFYDERETAKILRLSIPTIQRKRRETSDLSFCRFGRRIWYRGASILAALAAAERRSTSDNPNA